MAIGKKTLDIFAPTTGKKPDISLDVEDRKEGRPPAAAPYTKVTVTLFNRQVLFLDKGALAIKERTGENVFRAEMIRALVDAAKDSLNPEGPDFDKVIRELFPILQK